MVFSFVPEVGDQMMVGFEQGNPSMPFVLGSLFHGKNTSQQGGPQNHLKSLTTKSGHTIEFDDEAGGTHIIIKDASGNQICLDTKGKSITITAMENITLQAKNIDLSASQTLTLSAGENVSTAAGENISQYAGNNATISAKHVTTVADENVVLQAKKIQKTAEEIKIDSTKEDLQLQSSKSVNVKSAEKVKLF